MYEAAEFLYLSPGNVGERPPLFRKATKLFEILKFAEFNIESIIGCNSIAGIFRRRTLDLASRNLTRSLARGLSYYTGTIMEINVPILPAVSAAAGGMTG